MFTNKQTQLKQTYHKCREKTSSILGLHIPLVISKEINALLKFPITNF